MKFIMTVKVPVEAIDCIDARIQALQFVDEHNLRKENRGNAKIKLQRIFDVQKPECVDFDC